jgi:type I restriction enzyme S subunit
MNKIKEGYKETELGLIPNDWEVDNFEKIGIVVIDGDRGENYPKQNEFYDSGYCLFLSTKNVTKKGFKFEEIQFITEEKDKKLRKGKLNKEDIILTTRGTVGNIAYFDKNILFDNIRINSGMVILRNISNFISNLFLYKLFFSDILNNQISSVVFGSAQPQLTVKQIKNFKIPLPPLPEQEKIASILTTWDNAIEKTEKLIETKTKLKKALMQQLLTGKKRFKEFIKSNEYKETELGLIPVDWEAYNFEKIGIVVIDGDRGENYPRQNEFYDSGYCLFLSTKNVTKKGFKFEEIQFITEEKDKKLRKGKLNKEDIILTTRGTVGNIAYFDKNILFDNIRINSGMVILRNISNFISNLFLYKLFFSDILNNQISSVVFGSAQPQLTVKQIKNFKIPLPPLPEQKKIASVLTSCDKEIELLEKKLETLKNQKKGLMQKLLTGQIRVKV